MKKALIIIGAVLCAAILLGGAMYFKLSRDAERARAALPFEEIDMGSVADGTYQGEADAKLVYAKVEVTVKDHAIAGIRILEHKNGMGKKAEAITDDMIAANDYDVDAVSGATLSSEVIKSAVSAALKKGEN